MTKVHLTYEDPVTIVGGGQIDREMIVQARRYAPAGPVAADGAADVLEALDQTPAAIIGDLDSVSDPATWRQKGIRVVEIAEQDTTDFEKCLYSIDAPAYLGIGFTGKRMDHTLAVFHAMLRHSGKQVVLLGEVEAMTLLPAGRQVSLDLEIGDTVSLFPLQTVNGLSSSGLRWPIDGLEMAPGRMVGTSNEVTDGPVTLFSKTQGLLVFVPRRALGALLAGICAP